MVVVEFDSPAPQIVAQGIADEAELGLETLQARIAEEVADRGRGRGLPARKPGPPE
jgi:hypothetical protein